MESARKNTEVPHASENPLHKESVINAFCSGLKETLNTMASVELEFERPSLRTTWQTEGDLTGYIDFETKDFKGSLYIHLTSMALLKLYNQMLCENNTEVTAEITDCIGEISNVAYGVAKGKLDPLQLKFSMSLPKTVRTQELTRLNFSHLAIPFNIQGQKCLLEIVMLKK